MEPFGPPRDELDKYLYRLEEAKKRDHRRLGKELGLFMFHPYAPGAPFYSSPKVSTFTKCCLGA